MIAITIFMGLNPRLDSALKDRAISTEGHHAEKVTTRVQPTVVESNAVPVPLSAEMSFNTVVLAAWSLAWNYAVWCSLNGGHSSL
jgi:hypothetical protein